MRYARSMVPVALTAALLAGCGTTPATPSSSPSPAKSAALSAKEIVQKSGEALNKAGSYRMRGDIVSSGDKMSIDVKVQGSESFAVISMGDQGSITVLNVAGTSYFQADEVFWKKTGGIDAKTYNSVFKDKWVKPKAGDTNMQKFTEFTDAKAFLDPAGSESLTVGEKTTINGTSALTLKDPSASGSALYVAAEGEPYPLRVEHGTDGKIDFSEFGAKFAEVKAPPPDKVISL
ncbi:MAG TPA: hypothetical protein VFC01_03255 [Mycobacterium sp.]|nr:hypothetical protein [Mycobacterium sp.]